MKKFFVCFIMLSALISPVFAAGNSNSRSSGNSSSNASDFGSYITTYIYNNSTRKPSNARTSIPANQTAEPQQPKYCSSSNSNCRTQEDKSKPQYYWLPMDTNDIQTRTTPIRAKTIIE